MNRSFVAGTVSIAALLVLSVAADAHAQGTPAPPRAWPGAGKMRQSGRRYDPATVETVRGEVVGIERMKGSGAGKGSGVHLLLKTASEEIAVLLGPAWYVDRQPMKLAVKDQIEVRGSRVTAQAQPAIIAARVTKGDQVMQLRDDAGVPAWSKRGGGQ